MIDVIVRVIGAAMGLAWLSYVVGSIIRWFRNTQTPPGPTHPRGRTGREGRSK